MIASLERETNISPGHLQSASSTFRGLSLGFLADGFVRQTQRIQDVPSGLPGLETAAILSRPKLLQGLLVVFTPKRHLTWQINVVTCPFLASVHINIQFSGETFLQYKNAVEKNTRIIKRQTSKCQKNKKQKTEHKEKSVSDEAERRSGTLNPMNLSE